MRSNPFRRLFMGLLALFAVTATAHADTFGVERLSGPDLGVNVEHFEGVTLHSDSGASAFHAPAARSLRVPTGAVAALAAGGLVLYSSLTGDPSGIILATGAPAMTAELKDAIEESMKLTKQMLDPETGLEAKIKKGLESELGVAELKEQVQKTASDNAEAIKKINEETAKIAKELEERQDEFETKFGKSAPGGGGDPYASVMKTLEAEGLPDDIKAKGSSLRNLLKAGISLGGFDVKAIYKAVTSLAASGGDTQIPIYEPTIIAPGQQPITLLDVLPRSSTQSSLIYWVREVLGSRTNNTGIQSLDFTGTDQGTALGESDFVFNQESAETRTFGHTAKIAIQLLEDVGQLRGYLDNQMRYMVRFDLEDQILNGDGTGKNISGIKNQATAYDVTQDAGTANLQKLDVLKWAVTQTALTFFPATGMVLHPNDATDIVLLKDGDQRYLFVSNPNDGQMIRPWGVPVVSTTQQTEDEFTVGAMNQVEVVTRKDVEVMVSTENEDDFDKLLATMRAYGRFGLKVYQPGSLIDGDFSVAITGS